MHFDKVQADPLALISPYGYLIFNVYQSYFVVIQFVLYLPRIVTWSRVLRDNINDLTRNRFKNYIDKKQMCHALLIRY